MGFDKERKISFLGYRRNQWVTEYPDARKFHTIKEAKTAFREISESIDFFSGLQKAFIIEHYGYENETVVTQTCNFARLSYKE